MSNVPTNYITRTHGLNSSFFKKTCKTLGLNTRVNLSFLKTQHIKKLNSAISKVKTGKILKQYIYNNIKFYKTLKRKKNSSFNLLKNKNDSKKSKKQTKKISKKR